MTEEQIKHMVDRFLGWRLPANFSPDAGISFKPTFNEHMPFGPMRHEPMGTNLFDAEQATGMVRHMVEGMPEQAISAAEARAERAEAAGRKFIDHYPGTINDGLDEAVREMRKALNKRS